MFTKHILIKDPDPQYTKNSWTQQEGDDAVESWAEDPRRLLAEKMLDGDRGENGAPRVSWSLKATGQLNTDIPPSVCPSVHP